MSLGRRFDIVFTMAVLLLSVGMFSIVLRGAGDTVGGDQGDLAFTLLWLGLYLILIPRIILNGQRFIALLWRGKLMLVLPLYALSSAAWAHDPKIVIRRGVALLLTYLCGAYIAMKFTLWEQLRMAAACLAVTALLSYIFQMFFPGFVPAVDFIPGAWNGVFEQKNMLARWMVLGAIVFLCLLAGNRRYRLIKIGGMLVCAGLVLLSRSATGVIVLAALALVFPFARRWRRPMTTRQIPAMILLIVAAAFAIFQAQSHSGDLLQIMGKDSTLTGRTKLWAASAIAIARRPVLGYGYTDFWRQNPESFTLSDLVRWNIPHAHNGYVETLLEIGFAGLALLVLTLIVFFVKAIREYRRTGQPEYLWPLMLAFFLIYYNFSESSFLQDNNLIWILFCSASFSLYLRAPRPATAEFEETPGDGEIYAPPLSYGEGGV